MVAKESIRDRLLETQGNENAIAGFGSIPGLIEINIYGMEAGDSQKQAANGEAGQCAFKMMDGLHYHKD